MVTKVSIQPRESIADQQGNTRTTWITFFTSIIGRLNDTDANINTINMTSPNGTRYAVTISNSGTLTVVPL